MIITFLGTGTSQGVPVIACDCEVCRSIDFRDKRLRTSVHVLMDGLSLVIDTGPDFRQQMLRERIKSVDAILFTHAHKDHTAGMDDIRSYNFINKMDMPVYAESPVIDQLKQEFSYIFNGTEYPGIPRVTISAISTAPFHLQNVLITPIRVMHHQLPVLGFRIGDFTYITDANFISAAEKEKIAGSKVLVLNALQIEPHISHYTLEQAVDLAKELNIPKTYFTHISHKLGFHANVSANLPEGIDLAWDGLKVSI